MESNVTELRNASGNPPENSAEPMVVGATGVLAILATLSNCLMLVLLRKLEKLNWSTRFHVGVQAVSDIVYSIFMFLWQSLINFRLFEETVGVCKFVFVVGLTAEYMAPTVSIFMSIDGLILLQSEIKHLLGPSTQVRLIARLAGAVSLYVVLHTIAVILPEFVDLNAQGSGCIINQPHVYYPPLLKAHLAILCTLFACNLALLCALTSNLRKVFAKSNSLKRPDSGSTTSTDYLRSTTPESVFSVNKRKAELESEDNTSPSSSQRTCAPYGEQTSVGGTEYPNDDLAVSRCQDEGELGHVMRQKLRAGGTSKSERGVVAEGNAGDARQRRTLLLVTSLAFFFFISSVPQVVVGTLYVACPGHCGLPPQATGATATFKVIQAIFNVAVFLAKSAEARELLRKWTRAI